MEIKITSLLSQDLWPCYGSIATHGNNAGQTTWNAAKEEAENHSFVTDDTRGAIQNHFVSYGAWETEEIQAWDDQELTALLIQDIASNLSNIGIDLDEFEYYECLTELKERLDNAEQEFGFCSEVFVGTDNELYYYVGE